MFQLLKLTGLELRPPGGMYTEYSTFNAFTKRLSQSNMERMCKRDLRGGYLESLRTWNSHPAKAVLDPTKQRFLVFWDEVTRKDQGFIVGGMLKGTKVFFLAVICTPLSGFGWWYLQMAEDRAKALGAQQMVLSAVPKQTAFYMRQGYRFGPGPLVEKNAKRTNRPYMGNFEAYAPNNVVPNTLYTFPGLGGNQGPTHHNGPVDGFLMYKLLSVKKNS